MSHVHKATVVGVQFKGKGKAEDALLQFWEDMKRSYGTKDPQETITIDHYEYDEVGGWSIFYIPDDGMELKSDLSPSPEASAPAETFDSERPVPIADIFITAHNPRKAFDADKLKALADDIAKNGLINSVTVRPKGRTKYELVSGERRIRACRLLGMQTIPARVRQLTDEQMLDIMLSENLHRVDLNAVEEANHLKRVLELGHLTQAALAARIGKSPDWVSARLRLVYAPAALQDEITRRRVNVSSATELLGWQQSVLYDEIWKQVKSELVDGEELPRARVREIIKAITDPAPVKPMYETPAPVLIGWDESNIPAASLAPEPSPVKDIPDDDGPEDPAQIEDDPLYIAAPDKGHIVPLKPEFADPEPDEPCPSCVIGQCSESVAEPEPDSEADALFAAKPVGRPMVRYTFMVTIETDLLEDPKEALAAVADPLGQCFAVKLIDRKVI